MKKKENNVKKLQLPKGYGYGIYLENEEKVKKLSVYMPKKTIKSLPQIKKFVQSFVPKAKFNMKGNVLHIDGGGKSMKRLSQLIYNEFYVDKVNWNESINLDNVCEHEEIETFEEYYGTGENQSYKYYKCAECWEEIVPDDAERNDETESHNKKGESK